MPSQSLRFLCSIIPWSHVSFFLKKTYLYYWVEESNQIMEKTCQEFHQGKKIKIFQTIKEHSAA